MSRLGRRVLPVVVAVVVISVAAGVTGAVLTVFLHAVQELAYGYADEAFAVGVAQAAPQRRVLAMAVGGLVVGLGWWALRRESGNGVPVSAAVSDPSRRLPIVATTGDALLQITAVGSGASLGREGAPRQVAAAIAGWWVARSGLPVGQQRTLIACGAGARLAAVYNVPLAGALFTLEVLLRTAAPRRVAPAIATSAIATVVAWPVVGRQPVYEVPDYRATWTLLVAAALLGVLAAVTGRAFNGLTQWARTHAPSGWRLPLATTVSFTAIGATATVFPLILGNGRGPAEFAFLGGLGVLDLAVLFVLRPLCAAVCLGGGAAGGLLTPALATGALLGAMAGIGWSLLWPGSPIGGFAVVGAAAVLAVTQRAPLMAAVLTVELTGGLALTVPVAVAVLIAITLGRRLTERVTAR